MKSGALLWLGGWASNILCWKNDIEILYPEHSHKFLDAHPFISDTKKLIDNVNTFKNDSASKHQSATVIAWSMGSLLLHKIMEMSMMGRGNEPLNCDLSKDLKLISLCPIFDFCHPAGAWTKASLTIMKERLTKKREAVLHDFWIQMTSLPSKGNRIDKLAVDAAWQSQVENYSIAELTSGLEFLRDSKIDIVNFPLWANHFLFSSENDSITSCRPDPHFSQWSEYPEGHLPFLHYPDLLKKVL